jgi:hypothetical protein
LLYPVDSQERQRKQREAQVRAKVAASAFARGYLDGIVTRVFDQLADAGYFYDPVEREVSTRSCKSNTPVICKPLQIAPRSSPSHPGRNFAELGQLYGELTIQTLWQRLSE